MISDSELIERIRTIIEAEEYPVVKVIDCQFLFDEYDRLKRESMEA